MNNKTEKPATPRTDVAPTVGYVLSVDRKLKAQFETPEDAGWQVSGSNKPTRCFRLKYLMQPHAATHRW
ncbi:MAG: hypothetical protein WBM51_11145, partial [Pseudolabrys sp.]